MHPFLFLSLLATIPSALGHGYLSHVGIDGKWYDGNSPGTIAKVKSPIRQVSSQGPINLLGGDQSNMICGKDAKKADMVAPANPGSKVAFRWENDFSPNKAWIHDTGPLMTYMASCGNTPCNEFDPKGAKWFKIDQAGKKSDGSWYQKDFMKSPDASYEVTIPKSLAPGSYLIRHEIIALHIADQGKAEFYPACVQIQVGGNGDGRPEPLVSFPGAYKPEDPGILVNPYAVKDYQFPGGPIAKILTSGGSTSGSGSSSTPSSTTTSGRAPSSTNSKTCKVKRHQPSVKRSKRNLSRVMARFLDRIPLF